MRTADRFPISNWLATHPFIVVVACILIGAAVQGVTP